jgi:hypothetical protein
MNKRKPYSPGNPSPARRADQRRPHFFDSADVMTMAIHRFEQGDRGVFRQSWELQQLMEYEAKKEAESLFSIVREW